MEQARTQTIHAADRIREMFGELAGSGCLDAEFTDAFRARAVGVTGLPFYAPVVRFLLAKAETARVIDAAEGDVLFVLHVEKEAVISVKCWIACGTAKALPAAEKNADSAVIKEIPLVPEAEAAVIGTAGCVLLSPGKLNEQGELVLDLLTLPVGTHYPVNLLLGNRMGYAYPLVTTPKSAVDALGRGSFRAAGGEQVLATRCVLAPEENGEPANRQFYFVEDGRQIFYSANVHENVKKAFATESQNRTSIFYETDDGLSVKRTIFLLPQEYGMPGAVEAQRVEIKNNGERERILKIVMTGVFGIANPTTIANDDVYANIVQESEVTYIDGKPYVLSLHAKPAEEQTKKKFALLLMNGEGLDEFCTDQADFIGEGTIGHPDLVFHLPSRYTRKMAPFFAMAKTFSVKAGETAVIDEFIGMTETARGISPEYEDAIASFIKKYKDPEELDKTFASVTEFQESYQAYIRPETGNPDFDAYVGRNLPFQVLYQTYVSRAFAWTQKSYRETGFREIQDIYASMYYLSSIGKNDLIKDLIANWIRNVWKMGYAYHDFTFSGKEPGDCSDDQLWLVQAVYRYVKLTGDVEFLLEKFPVAGTEEAGTETRSLWETIMACITYSGKISVGKHGLPLLDKADWNDTLKLDPEVLKGPAKEKLYREQIARSGRPYGTPFENTLTESTMNACLLIIAADETAEMGEMLKKHTGELKTEEFAATSDLSCDAGDNRVEGTMLNIENDVEAALEISERVAKAMQKYAWKGDFFARCLINDGREGGYTYLGATGDGLSLDPNVPGSYYLNSYSWPILAGIATEEEIRSMLGIVKMYLKTEAGLKLCTLVDYDRLGVRTGTALYFPGDRENSGVFKHAAMMATVASLKAAKTVADEELARELADLAFFMIDRTLPYKSMENPFVLKGNPRFCTQYNNSETCENIGPMLSGTATWLTLAVFEIFGAEVGKETITIRPLLRPGETGTAYSMTLSGTKLHVKITGSGQKFRADASSRYLLDGKPLSPDNKSASASIIRPDGGEHTVEIVL